MKSRENTIRSIGGERRSDRARVAARLIAVAAAIGALATSTGQAHATATDLTTGLDHSCVVDGAGGVACWGSNTEGQLGDGTVAFRSTPVGVVGLASGVATVSAGYRHTCALTTGGGVKCWGLGGSLGDGGTTDSSTPVDVTGLTTGVASISAGTRQTCAVTVAGGLKCWGVNLSGEIGDGTTMNRTAPVDVTGLTSGVAAVSAGNGHTCALTTGGGLKCWGYNLHGQLGDGTNTNSPVPVDVVGLASGVAAISAGTDVTCAITTSGGLKCWGKNSRGNLGDGTVSSSSTPVDVVGLESDVASVATPKTLDVQTCAITTASALKCWGSKASLNEPADVRFHGSDASQVVVGVHRWVRSTLGEVHANRGGVRSGYGPLVDQDPPVNLWQEGCVFGFGDADGDGLCDSYDACETLDAGQVFPPDPYHGPQPRMVLNRIGTDPVVGNDKLTLRGKFSLPPGRSFGDLDPLNDGARIAMVSPGGTTESLALPAGSYAGRGTAGWTLLPGSRPRWRFTDSTGAPGTRTVARMTITDRGGGLPGGLVDLVATASAETFLVTAEDLPLQALVLLDDTTPGAGALCGQAVFNCACAFNSRGNTLSCVNGPNRPSSCLP
jgi:Regulator of chromosome condensation (RCC1) repeat